MSLVAAAPQPVLADLIPRTRYRDAMLVLAGTAFLAVASQLTVPLWWTPVPLSLSTFAVLLSGAALGPSRAFASTGLYLALGMAGAPIFANQESGWAMVSFGYVIGYIPAAVAVGALARRRADRTVIATVLTAVIGSALVYACGLPWLCYKLDVGFARGLELGVWPFLAGDAIKAAAAALLLPAAWQAVDRFSAD